MSKFFIRIYRQSIDNQKNKGEEMKIVYNVTAFDFSKTSKQKKKIKQESWRRLIPCQLSHTYFFLHKGNGCFCFITMLIVSKIKTFTIVLFTFPHSYISPWLTFTEIQFLLSS